MDLGHTSKLDWHDSVSCRLDYAPIDDYSATCLRCGLSGLVPYSLPPLPFETSFRLLWLLPGKLDETIRCEIHVNNLRSLPSFFAVSYTWADDDGDDRKLAQIFIHNKTFRVTKNCDTVLRRLREWSANVYVWIDAVCIDQDNDMERGHQVKLMPQIYHQARKVFVYVGEHDDESHKAIMDLNIPGQNPVFLGTKWRAMWRAISTRKYFTRLWIIQEIALARRAIVFCGDSFFDWKDITSHNTIDIERQNEHHSVLRLDHSLFTKPDIELFVLDCGKPARAKDPRDKVYGLLGLLPARRIGTVAADYTISTQQLYTQVAIQLAELYGWPAVLVRAGSKYQSLSCLPSWVPDWSSTTDDVTRRIPSNLPRLESNQIPPVSGGKICLRLYYTHHKDLWVVPDLHLEDDFVETKILIYLRDPVWRILALKHRGLLNRDRLQLRLEQQQSSEGLSNVLCEATFQKSNMAIIPIEQCIFKPKDFDL